VKSNKYQEIDKSTHLEDGVVIGNVFPKYTTTNPVGRFLVGRFHKVLDMLVDDINPETIHEVGCGEGFLLSRYHQSNRRLLGTDFSSRIIQIARKNCAEYIANGEIFFQVADIYSMISDHHGAEVILVSEVLEHLEAPDEALKVLKTLAKPYIIFSVPREPVWRLLNITRGSYLSQMGNTPGHLKHWTRRGFVRLISQHFEVLKVFSPLPWTIILGRTIH
jgi:2-polyprenyl-3-methyl-5-hydroxy-6-metoxy-1,4-benzoquinol methylase